MCDCVSDTKDTVRHVGRVSPSFSHDLSAS